MDFSYIGLSSKSLKHFKFRIVFGLMTAVLILYLWTVIPGRYYKVKTASFMIHIEFNKVLKSYDSILN